MRSLTLIQRATRSKRGAPVAARHDLLEGFRLDVETAETLLLAMNLMTKGLAPSRQRAHDAASLGELAGETGTVHRIGLSTLMRDEPAEGRGRQGYATA